MTRCKWLALLLLLLFCAAGCAPAGDKKGATLVERTDSKGNLVKLPAKPQRIASLTLGTDEILMDLVAPERIAALTHLSDDPGISHIADRSPLVRNKLQSNTVEAILALKPDLVLIADWWNLEILDTLRDMQVPVYVYKTPYSVAEVRDTVNEIAQIVGEPETGAAVLRRFDAKLQRLSQQIQAIPLLERKRVLALTGQNAFGGKGSLFDDMCRYAGVENCLHDLALHGAQTLSKEEIIRRNPDAILIPTWSAAGMLETRGKETLLNDAALQGVAAIRNKDIIEVSGRCVYCVSQYVADSVSLLAQGAYPAYIE